MNQINKAETPIKIGATLSIADYYLPHYLSSYLTNNDALLCNSKIQNQLLKCY